MTNHHVIFMIPGNPLPKARPRVVGNRAYTPARTKAWEEQVAILARVYLGHRAPLDGPVAVELRFYRQNRALVDIDNLAKSILDALNGIAYHDDAQVVEAHLYKDVDKARPRVEVAIWSVADAADIQPHCGHPVSAIEHSGGPPGAETTNWCGACVQEAQ